MKFLTKKEITKAISDAREELESTEEYIAELENETPFTMDFENAPDDTLVFITYECGGKQSGVLCWKDPNVKMWTTIGLIDNHNVYEYQTYEHIRRSYLDNQGIKITEISEVKSWKVHYSSEEEA